MPRLEWQEAYVTGVAGLDYEHRVLLELVNTSCVAISDAAQRDTLRDCLASLYERACAHFALEESVMRKDRYPLYMAHRAQHDALIETLREMMDSFEDGACAHCKRSLDDCLVNWFEAHFKGEDARLQRLQHVPRS
ncbi:MAG: hemerythrin family protein [Steroidobacteraceae bacterium]|nr:hemerythrin family protein [Pseudomonadota bacterium]MBP6107466.1 hemerythrin family protein [Steroidobacteraceae bacterium]MBP7014675.1 hemerythrin family protein [Steroidobacteraceae bacterium]